MALFKIFRGNEIEKLTNPNADGYKPLVDGYAYYNTDNHQLYIDARTDENDSESVERHPLNAYLAYSAKYDGATNPQEIHTTYVKDVSYISNTANTLGALVVTKGDGTTSSISHPAFSLTASDVTYLQNGYVTKGKKDGTILGSKATAEGSDTTASGSQAHAEGDHTTASGLNGSHAEGYYTTASGRYGSHAEGNHSVASGQGSHAEGSYVTASGHYSHAEGEGTIASGSRQHVSGKYNIEDTTNTYAEIIGNGTSTTHSNARTLDWNGNEILAGKLTIGVGPTNDMDVTTKQYVDNSISNISIPTDTSDLTNGAGFITSYTETDPTVPAWAKAANKPTYTASEVGALPSSTTYVSSFNGDSGDITYTAPVTSVNGQTGVVNLSIPAAQVQSDWNATAGMGVILNKPTIPTDTSDLTNGAEFTNKDYVDSILAANDALLFKGVVDTTHPLPASHEIGWVYKVGVAGEYAGQQCELGDTIYCIADGTTANNADWVILQTNIDGYVIGPSESSTGNITVFTGTTGKVIRDSGIKFGELQDNFALHYTAATATNAPAEIKTASNIYMSDTHLGINTTAPNMTSRNLYVKGKVFFDYGTDMGIAYAPAFFGYTNSNNTSVTGTIIGTCGIQVIAEEDIARITATTNSSTSITKTGMLYLNNHGGKVSINDVLQIGADKPDGEDATVKAYKANRGTINLVTTSADLRLLRDKTKNIVFGTNENSVTPQITLDTSGNLYPETTSQTLGKVTDASTNYKPWNKIYLNSTNEALKGTQLLFTSPYSNTNCPNLNNIVGNIAVRYTASSTNLNYLSIMGPQEIRLYPNTWKQNGTTATTDPLDTGVILSKTGLFSTTATLTLGTVNDPWSDLYISTQAMATDKGIKFMTGTATVAQMGAATSGFFGLYSASSIAIRPNINFNGSMTSNGITISSTTITPVTTNKIELGTNDKTFKSLVLSTQGSAKTYGLTYATTAGETQGRIGVSSDGSLGIYSHDIMTFRTNMDNVDSTGTLTDGMRLSNTTFYPLNSGKVALGTTNSRFGNGYFGALSTDTATGSYFFISVKSNNATGSIIQLRSNNNGNRGVAFSATSDTKAVSWLINTNQAGDKTYIPHWAGVGNATSTIYFNEDGEPVAAPIISSVSNTWTNGTTAGPTIKTTVNGVTGAAVAIPVATTSQSGVVSTTTQTFGGRKGFGVMDRFARNSSNAANAYPEYNYLYTNSGTLVGEHYYAVGDETNVTIGQYYWKQYSPNTTANTQTTGKYELYSLPSVDKGMTATASYDIYTSKGVGNLNRIGSTDWGTTSRYTRDHYYNSAGSKIAEIRYDSGNATNVTTGKWTIYQFSPNTTADTMTTGKYEAYALPTVDKGMTANETYEILTTKQIGLIKRYGYNSDGSTRYVADNILYNNAGSKVGETFYDAGNATNVTSGVYSWLQYSPNTTANTQTTGKYERYNLPTVATGMTENIAYDILTTKNPIYATTEQWGVVSTTTQRFAGVKNFYNTISIGENKLADSATIPGVLISPAGYIRLVRDNASLGAYIMFSNKDSEGNNLTSGGCYMRGGGKEQTINFNCPVAVNTSASTAWTLGGQSTATNFAFSVSGISFFSDTVHSNGAFNSRKNTDSTASQASFYIYNRDRAYGYLGFVNGTTAITGYGILSLGNSTAAGTDKNAAGRIILYTTTTRATTLTGAYGALGSTSRAYVNAGYFKGTQVWGAVWNDYAEFRETKEEIEPGRCVIETGNGDLILSTERLQSGGEIVSDTYGFAIGQTKKNNTPIATAGRVLAYLLEDKEYAKQFIGYPVGTGPNGTVSIMTDQEARDYPWKIIGTISEIPNYDKWLVGKEEDNEYIEVKNRIWIRI